MKIVTLIENDPVLGVRYGEKEIFTGNDDAEQYSRTQQAYAKHQRIKARNIHFFNKQNTTQK